MSLSERELRERFGRAAGTLPVAAVAPKTALRAGRQRQRAHRAVHGLTVVVVAGAAVLTWNGVTGRSGPAAHAAVTCLGDRAVAEGTVTAGAEGVRVEVDNATGALVRLAVGPSGAFVPPGRSVLHLAIPPGRASVTCVTPAGPVRPASFRVVDPGDVYTPARVPCAEYPLTLEERAGVHAGDPVSLTRARLAGSVPAGARVEPAGYPDDVAQVVRVRDGERLLAVLRWHQAPAPDAWMLDEQRLCLGA